MVRRWFVVELVARRIIHVSLPYPLEHQGFPLLAIYTGVWCRGGQWRGSRLRRGRWNRGRRRQLGDTGSFQGSSIAGSFLLGFNSCTGSFFHHTPSGIQLIQSSLRSLYVDRSFYGWKRRRSPSGYKGYLSFQMLSHRIDGYGKVDAGDGIANTIPLNPCDDHPNNVTRTIQQRPPTVPWVYCGIRLEQVVSLG